MSVTYPAIGWNRQKRLYDLALGGGIAFYLAVFTGAGALLRPQATVETLLIRGLGTLALLLLHVILAIGPLCRLHSRFLPLLYNRRHLGVAMFLIALAHGVFATIQFHSFGTVQPLASLLTGNTRFSDPAAFPFEILGLAALLILFLMAATSHDFWLHNLGPVLWKSLHLSVYLAYVLLVGHVAFGALQSEAYTVPALLLATGLSGLAGLHLVAARRERRLDRTPATPAAEGFVAVGALASIPDHRAKVVTLGAERVAVFRIGDEVSALSNVCRHQMGPLGEGRIVDGCVTCPWHGYQYHPRTGCSPPPYQDKVQVFRTRIENGIVWVHP
jgi:nitrite reductase/ring-hydroxylating ferredoxin subunit/DMSO/TMAO reductase YedYZ heme-binding membrane subunit